MELFKESLCFLQTMQKNLGKLLNLESQIARSATPTPIIIQVVPIYFFRYKQGIFISVGYSHALTWQVQKRISKQGSILRQKHKLYLSMKVFITWQKS